MGALRKNQMSQDHHGAEFTSLRRVTRSMTANESNLKSSFRVIKSPKSSSPPRLSPVKKTKKSSKPSAKIEIKTEDTSADEAPSTPVQAVYMYTKKFVPGITSIETFGQPRGLWRLIKSEYTLPLRKFSEREHEVVLIQNTIAHSLYALIVQAILWNQTSGRQARPVLNELLARYPDPQALSEAKFDELSEMLYPIGLYNSRAKRLVDMARTWVERPPLPGRGYGKARDRNYVAVPLAALDEPGVRQDVSDELADAHARSRPEFWEIAHLPGVGPYALDSFRIFHRDEMRGLAADWLGDGAPPGFEPEWKRVVPADKDLRAYLKYRWEREGWDWDPPTGRKKRL